MPGLIVVAPIVERHGQASVGMAVAGTYPDGVAEVQDRVIVPALADVDHAQSVVRLSPGGANAHGAPMRRQSEAEVTDSGVDQSQSVVRLGPVRVEIDAPPVRDGRVVVAV
jgi:hypothetical protein